MAVRGTGDPAAGGTTLPCLLLAAGQSTRMGGRDKLLEPVGGVPLIRDRALAVLKAGLDLWVALPGPDHLRAHAIGDLAARLLVLPGSAEGIGGTLREGVAALPPCPAFMILPADMPGIGADDLQKVVAARASDPACIVWRGATAGGRPGHPVLFDTILRQRFADLNGQDGGQVILTLIRDQTRLVLLPGQSAICDLDTPEDWAQWRSQTDR